MCDCEDQNFRATTTGRDDPRILTVEGMCTCRQAGNRLYLEPHPGGINPDPTVMVLRLVVEKPDAALQVITETKVEPYVAEIGQKVRSVLIRLPQGCEITLPITRKVEAAT